MEVLSFLARSLLLFLAAVCGGMGVARGLECLCNNAEMPSCVFSHSMTCVAGQLCAVVYDRYREASTEHPNPRALCLEESACGGTNSTTFVACCDQDRCNDENFAVPVYPTTVATEHTTGGGMEGTGTLASETTDLSSSMDSGLSTLSSSSHPLFLGLITGVPLVLVSAVLVLLAVTYGYYVRLKKTVKEEERKDKWDLEKPPLEVVNFQCTISATDEGTSSCSSGSGSGLPLLTQRTVARTITLGERIGSGRFGQVFVGDYQGEKVAVKKFVSHDDKSWFRETEIYNTVYLIHENILGFFASDMVSNNGATELWLITQYHPNGSLYDYLTREALPLEIVIRMITSFCNGLSHLHTELPGTCGKPAIAHRDIKSRNILVKNDLECCIADFGLAVMKNSEGLSLPTNPRQGTKRYMAPEILDESINMERFESFKQTDIYSLGLVVWEICNRCVLKDGIALEYTLPFQGLVPSDPNFEEMKRLVVDEKMQPPIHDEWGGDEVLSRLSKMMQECWYIKPNARPTAANLKKRMARLLQASVVVAPASTNTG